MEDPRTCRQLVGHDAAWARFLSVIRSGRLHHAWLLTGPEGVGKATMAFMMARTLLGARDHASAVGRRVSAGTHADLLVIARGVNEKSRKKGRRAPRRPCGARSWPTTSGPSAPSCTARRRKAGGAW
ncbi:hypothetical protein RAA17_17935 [Komagataeibacter rhaeticus]|nr:hypothetical protein [Komagataeibacter rhaeticus]